MSWPEPFQPPGTYILIGNRCEECGREWEDCVCRPDDDDPVDELDSDLQEEGQ